MHGFLKIDGELFDITGLSYGAMMLYGFIKLRMGIADVDAQGVKFINYMDGNNPYTALHATRKQVLKWTKELCDHDLIYTDGHGISFKVYLKTDFISLKNDADDEVKLPKGNLTDSEVKYPKGNLTQQKEESQVPKRELVKYPKGDLSSTQKGTWPLISYKELLTNTKEHIYIDGKSPILIPTLEEVTEEVKEKGYTCDPASFYDYNRMRGWRNVSDWRAALSLYNRNSKNKTYRRGNSVTGAEAGINADDLVELPYVEQDPESHDAGAEYDDIIDIFEAQ